MFLCNLCVTYAPRGGNVKVTFSARPEGRYDGAGQGADPHPLPPITAEDADMGDRAGPISAACAAMPRAPRSRPALGANGGTPRAPRPCDPPAATRRGGFRAENA